MADPYTVRELTEGDLTELLSWRNHPDIRRFMFTKHLITVDEHRAWFHREDLQQSERRLLVSRSAISIGFVQFKLRGNGTVADWGFYSRPGSVKGTGRMMCTAALDYAFDVLGLEVVRGLVIENNLRSIRLHDSMGFIRKATSVSEGAPDQLLVNFEMLDQDWRKLRMAQGGKNEQH